MRLILGIGMLLMTGGSAVALTTWLATRQIAFMRMAAAVLSGALVLYCAVVVLALVADNGTDGVSTGGVLSTLAFAAIGTGAALAARRALKIDGRLSRH
jgi:hypothetical protein